MSPVLMLLEIVMFCVLKYPTMPPAYAFELLLVASTLPLFVDLTKDVVFVLERPTMPPAVAYDWQFAVTVPSLLALITVSVVVSVVVATDNPQMPPANEKIPLLCELMWPAV